ncbi:MAG: C4-type zinc ribbon domain-containing protein [Alphaproteobacteria bacterium]|nr:C4-type zinc ribbon domain-containing protein [Alphaproteobacteria bacterium]
MQNNKNFSIEEKLVALTWLQHVNSKIDKIHILRGELPKEVQELEDEITGLNNRIIKTEEEINGINDYINEKLEAIKNSKNLIAKYEKQSDNVKNNREFEAINKEIEVQNLDIKLFEKNIRDANQDLGEDIQQLDLTKKKVSELNAILKIKKEKLNETIDKTSKQESELKSYLDQARSQIENTLLLSSDRIRKNFNNGLAVVKIERDACAGCFNAVPAQRQSEIRMHKKIIICENCGRILVDNSIIEQLASKSEQLEKKLESLK